jgi:hypothetical protein
MGRRPPTLTFRSDPSLPASLDLFLMAMGLGTVGWTPPFDNGPKLVFKEPVYDEHGEPDF